MIERWVGFWDRREGPESLALTRMLVALVILIDLGSGLVLGLVPELWAPPPFGLGHVGLSESPPLFSALFGVSSGTVLVLYGVSVASAALLFAGVALRPAALLLAIASAELARLAPDGERAVDVLLRIAVLVLACSRADACFSVASWIAVRRGRPRVLEIPAWPRQLLLIQLVWVYFSAAHNRSGEAWWPAGEFAALSQVLSDPHYARFTPGWTAAVYPLTQVATALTMTFELGAPLLIPLTLFARAGGGRVFELARRFHLRFAIIILGVCLHLGILVTLRLGIFSLGMLALFTVLFDSNEVRRVLALARGVAARGAVQ